MKKRKEKNNSKSNNIEKRIDEKNEYSQLSSADPLRAYSRTERPPNT